MADKTVIVEIQYDTKEAEKNIKNLTAVIEGERVEQARLKNELEQGKISQNEYSQKVEESKQRMQQANSERKNTIKLINSEKGSVNQLKTQITDLTKKRDKLNLNTAEGRKKAEEYNKQLADMRNRLRDAQRETGKTGGAFASFGKNLSSLPGPIGGLINGISGMTKAALAFIATPIGLVIAALAVAIMAVKHAFTASEEGQNKFAKIMTVINAIVGNFGDLIAGLGEKIIEAFESPREAIKNLGEAIKKNITNRIEGMLELIPALGRAIKLVFQREFKEAGRVALDAVSKATIGVENMSEKLDGLIEKTKEFIEENEREAKLAAKVADMRAKAARDERQLVIDRAKLESEIAELRLKSREEEEYTAEQRKQFLEEARDLQDNLLKREKEVLELRRDAQVLENTFSRTNIENKDKEAQAIADVSRKEAERFNQQRQVQRELNRINKEIKREDKRIADEKKKIEDDEIKRRGEAILKLAELEFERLEKEAETYEAEKEIQIERENERFEREIANEKLLAEEKELIEAEHKARLAVIDVEYQSKVDKMREKNLANARSNLQDIISATAGMADSRVTIMSDAFSKISTINFKELKNFSDVANSIGQAAQGLTNLIISGHQEEFNELEAQKAAELELAGDNAAAREDIEKKFAKKTDDLKKKQFEDNKKKALIDGAIATALAVINALAMQPFIPLGVASAVAAGLLGGIQLATIATKKYTPSPKFAKGGGIVDGDSHATGGVNVYGDNGQFFGNVEGGEAMYVMKKDATAEIAGYSRINESYGGRSFFDRGSRKVYQDGGQMEDVATKNIEKSVDEAIQRTPIFVRVSDIETGMTNVNNVKKAGVV